VNRTRICPGLFWMPGEKIFIGKKRWQCPKSKGRRELLNLKSSIKYGNASVFSWRWKGKAYLM
jgi:hypothetical protein